MSNEELRAKVAEDIRCHRENGVDLNPFSTVLMRGSWERGFRGKSALMSDFLDAYERGKLAAEMINAKETP